MTEQMNYSQVAVAILSSLRLCQKMVNLKFFLVEESFSTFWALALLPLGQFLFGKRQVFGFCRLPFRPVVLEPGVIGGCRPFDQREPFIWEPSELEQIPS